MRHLLTAVQIEAQLMKFNWLPASYAHSDWLGEWAETLKPPHKRSHRLLRHVSKVLLEHNQLLTRYLKKTGETDWLLLPNNVLKPIAQALGIAMLGGWVRNGLSNQQVQQQLRVLTNAQRMAAIRYANELKALPYSNSGQGWLIDELKPSSLSKLGVGCMAALLEDEQTGAKTRFLMHFRQNFMRHVELNEAQRQEAKLLIHEHIKAFQNATLT
jgi:hypothetical protein